MAVKASATITLSFMVDVKATYRYYKLQASTSAAPSAPTTATPSTGAAPSGWTDSEPSYTNGSTNTLYFVDLTVFANDTWQYSKVSKSSSYEAAKEAYNKAVNAQNTANSANGKIDNLQIGGRNYALDTANSVVDYPNTSSNIEYKLSPKFIQEISGKQITVSAYAEAKGLVETTNSHYGVDLCIHYEDGTTQWGNFIRGNAIPMPDSNGDIPGRVYSKTFDVKDMEITSITNTNMFFRGYTCESFIIRNLKIELGNKATDWTPAPEDVEQSVNDAQNTANNAQQSADAVDKQVNGSGGVKEKVEEALASINIIEKSIQMLVTDNSGTTLLEQTGSGLSFNLSESQELIAKNQAEIAALQALVGDIDNASVSSLINELQRRTAYVDIVKDADGNAVLQLGNRDDADGFKLDIKKDSITFRLGNTEPLRLLVREDGTSYMDVDDINVDGNLVQGGFVKMYIQGVGLCSFWRGLE